MIGNSILVYRGDFDLPMVAAESHLSQVTMLLRTGQVDDALKQAQEALAIDPQSASVQASVGGALLEMHKIAEAQQTFGAVLQESAGLSRAESDAIAARIAQMHHPAF